jgi:hypothetical protein
MPSISDADFVAAWGKAGNSPVLVARLLGMTERGVYSRRERMEKRGVVLNTAPTAPGGTTCYTAPARNYEQRAKVDLRDGVAVVFSDAHWWPGMPQTVAHGALLRLVRTLKPNLVVANGDVFDGAAISRHDPDGWQNLPSVHAELETVKLHMAGIASAAKGARLMRTIGNHDLRFDRRLATQVPDYRHLAGMQLRDHLPEWAESWSIEINGAVMVKHRWHQGIHGAYNNALKGGRSIVTGHLHRLLASPWSDYNGRRWGVDTGTLSEPDAAQFDYAEDAAKNWGSGFVVLTFRDGQLGPPEFCEVINNRAWFRGQVVHEKAAADQLAHPPVGEVAAGAGGGDERGVQRVPSRVASGAHKQPAEVQMPRVRKARRAAG